MPHRMHRETARGNPGSMGAATEITAVKAARLPRSTVSPCRLKVMGLGVAAVMSHAVLVAVADGDENRLKSLGRHLAQECTTCHRIDGVDNGIPSIVGLEPGYFAETMAFYKDGRRNNPAMVSVAQSLDEAQVSALAAYFATLPKPPPKPSKKNK